MADSAVMTSIKAILGISDTSKDTLLNVYISKGSTLITTYMNIPSTTPATPLDVPTAYPDALIEYVTLCYRKRGNEGVKQFAQGSRSGTYESGLPDTVKDLLPSPFIRMMGVCNDVY